MSPRPLAPLGPTLDATQRARYARHLILPGLGLDGQRRLRGARVLLVGAGGLGSPAALYLAAAGVGTLGLVDDDLVDLTNLQRQIIHGQGDVGRPKVDSARDTLTRLTPDVTVHTHPTRLTAANALDLLADYDVVIDGSDNFPTRALVSHASARLLVPHVWASVSQYQGQLSVWSAGEGPCYHCVFPQQPTPDQVPSCAVGGVLGATVGALGSLLAVETVKLLTGIGEPLIGRLLVHDGLAATWDVVTVRRRPDCAVCGSGADPTRALGATTAPGEPTAYASVGERPTVTARDLADLLAAGATLIDVRDPGERDGATIPGALPVPLADLLGGARPWSADRVYVHCQSGARSARAVDALRANGIDAWDVRGGILAWLTEVDPEGMPSRP